MKNVLITGASGYIGSHVIVELAQKHFNIICIDNASNSYRKVFTNLNTITGKTIRFYSLDLSKETDRLNEIFNNHKIDFCIHLAALKSVSESIEQPLRYYRNNIDSLMNLLEMLEKYKCKGMLFSSSATVYSPNQEMPLTENSDVGNNLTNTYARTKYFSEEILKDYCNVHPDFKCIILRYFNPIGSHSSRLIDEHPKGKPQNLMPNILAVLKGKKEHLDIYGTDYDTPDGTALRDYIHVEDLAHAHLQSIYKMQQMIAHKLPNNLEIYNVGTGKGTSVLEIIQILKKYGVDVKHEMKDRRPGDLGVVYCDNTKILNETMWKPKLTVEDALKIYK